LRPFLGRGKGAAKTQCVGAATRTPRPVQSFGVLGRSPGSPLDRDLSGLPEGSRLQ